MTGSRRVLRRLGWGAIGLIAVLVAGVCAAWLFLASNAGQRVVLDFVQRQLADQLAGTLSVEGASLSPRGVIELHGVTLRDPDGGLVARVGDLEARADLPALAKHHARVELLRLARAELHLVNGPAGLNLSRALAARTPPRSASPPAATAPLSWEVVLDQLLVSELGFDYRPAPTAPPAYAVSDVTLSAHGRYGPSGTALFLSALGNLGAPLGGRLSVELAAEGGSKLSPIDPIHLKNLEVHVADAALRLNGEYRGGELQARIEQLVAPAEVVRAFAPSAPLAGVVRASGTAAIGPRGATLSLAVPTGDGRIAIDGRSGFEPLDAQATVTLQRADLSEVLDGTPATDLNGTIRARFAAGTPAPGRGELELDFGPSVVRTARFASIKGKVTTSGSDAHVESLNVVARGGAVSLSGDATPENVALQANVEFSDLGGFTGVLARAADVAPPALAGSGRLHATLRGPPERLEIAVAGKLARFEAGSFVAEGIALDGRLPNLAHPRVFNVRLRAARGSAGELPFNELAAKVQADRRSFSAEVSSAGLAGLVARVGGVIDAGGDGGLVERLELAVGGVAWNLENPVRLELADGFKVGAAALTSGPQRIELAGGLAAGRLDLVARARRVDLAQLPALFVPRSLELAGLVDFDARVVGTPRRPQVDASAELSGVGVRRYRGIDGHVGASLKDERLTGGVDLRRGTAGRAQASFDVPQALLAAKAGTPVAVRVRVDGEPLADMGRQLAMPQLAEGTFGFDATVSGTMDKPRLEASAQVRAGRWSQYPAADVDLTVTAAEDLRGALELTVKGGRARLEVLAPLSLAVLAKGVDLQRLRATPVEATLNAPQIDLATLAGSVLPAGLAGTARVEAHLEGTLAQPRGELRLGIDQAEAGAWTKGALRAELAVANETGATVQVQVDRAGQHVLSGRGALRALPEELDSLAALSRAPLELTLTAGPVGIGESLGALAPDLHGVLDGELTLGGSLGAPLLAVRANASDLAVRDQKLGALALAGSYAQRHLAVDATSTLPGGGGAKLAGGLDADLGLQALARVDLAAAPLRVQLTADALELKVLEAPLAGVVRQLGGRLDARLEVTGSLRDPTVRGSAQVRDGRVALVGYGSYRDLQADLSITDQILAIDRLAARSGSGSVVARARAQRASPSAPYQLDASVSLNRFPVTLNDQPAAELTGQTARLTGQIQGPRMSFDLRLDGLGVLLPEIGGGKDLQPLEPHPDFFLVRKQVRRARASADASAGGALDLKMHVEIPRGIQVESKDVRMEAGADLYLTMARGDLAMTGEVVTRSGRVEVMGRRFDITSARVSYAGDPPSNPRLDVQALYENLREQVKVKVGVSGSAQKPHIELSSEPPMEESEIATLLATGRRDLKRGSGGVAGGSGAYSIIGSFAAERLRKTISSQLPLDVLQVDVGDVASQGLAATKLEAGTYLTDRIYLGYRRNFGAAAGMTEPGHRVENPDEVRVEYQLSPSVTVESSFGNAGKGGADVVFTKDY